MIKYIYVSRSAINRNVETRGDEPTIKVQYGDDKDNPVLAQRVKIHGPSTVKQWMATYDQGEPGPVKPCPSAVWVETEAEVELINDINTRLG